MTARVKVDPRAHEGLDEGNDPPDDEASRESFPASDPPSTWSGEEDEPPERS